MAWCTYAAYSVDDGGRRGRQQLGVDERHLPVHHQSNMVLPRWGVVDPWVGVGLHTHRLRDDVDAQTQGSEAADMPVGHMGQPRLLRAVIRSCCYDVKIVVYMFHYLDLLKKSWPDWQCFPLRQQRPLRLLMRLWVAAFWSGSPHYLISLQLSP